PEKALAASLEKGIINVQYWFFQENLWILAPIWDPGPRLVGLDPISLLFGCWGGVIAPWGAWQPSCRGYSFPLRVGDGHPLPWQPCQRPPCNRSVPGIW